MEVDSQGKQSMIQLEPIELIYESKCQVGHERNSMEMRQRNPNTLNLVTESGYR